MTRLTIRETLHTASITYSGFDMPFAELRDWLDELAKEIPPEHMATASFEITSDSDYDGGRDVDLTIYYERPETDEEMSVRIANDAMRQASEARYREAQERATFEALKRKYG